MPPKHKSTWIVPYNVLARTIGLHNQTSVAKLQKHPYTFILVYFVSLQIDRNCVAFTLVYKMCHTSKIRFKTLPYNTHASLKGTKRDQRQLTVPISTFTFTPRWRTIYLTNDRRRRMYRSIHLIKRCDNATHFWRVFRKTKKTSIKVCWNVRS